LESLWSEAHTQLQWNCPFVLPFWLQTVWRHLGGKGDPYLLRVADGTNLVGIVPLCLLNDTAYFLGNPDVCDYQDIIATPRQGVRVMDVAIQHLAARGIRRLDLGSLHPDAVALQALNTLASDGAVTLQLSQDDVTYEMDLPSHWNDYLMQLSGKQRHEVRRKIRRLQVHGSYVYRMTADNGELEADTDAFLKLFQLNREDKAAFMDQTMSDYFRDLIQTLAEHGMLRLYLLKIDDINAATVLCFDYNGVRYLYNSGYDAQYHELSVGILSKVFSIQTGIDAGCRRYDFLKGSEVYKKRIGGVQTPLYRSRIELK
jgi:CelD/BcsL family acetyltransferase involved in cellulose biosynthesis